MSFPIPAALADLGIDGLHVYAIEMTTRFRRITRRDGILMHGPAGWAEFSPFWDYDARESASWLRAALADATTPRPAPLRRLIDVNATIPVVSPERAQDIVRASGARTAKVKVADPGASPASDLERVEAVRDALGPGGKIRVDANAAWDVASAVDALTQLDRAAGGLEYAEQPVATLEDLAAVRAKVPCPVAADELVRRAEDPLRVARAGAADILVMKVQPLGGIQRCLDLAAEAGLPVVVSSALESSIGLSAGLAFAAALPELPHACGLATGSLLTDDVVADRFTASHGQMEARRAEVSEERLAATSADPELAAAWRDRLDKCLEFLR